MSEHSGKIKYYILYLIKARVSVIMLFSTIPFNLYSIHDGVNLLDLGWLSRRIDRRKPSRSIKYFYEFLVFENNRLSRIFIFDFQNEMKCCDYSRNNTFQ